MADNLNMVCPRCGSPEFYEKQTHISILKPYQGDSPGDYGFEVVSHEEVAFGEPRCSNCGLHVTFDNKEGVINNEG